MGDVLCAHIFTMEKDVIVWWVKRKFNAKCNLKILRSPRKEKKQKSRNKESH